MQSLPHVIEHSRALREPLTVRNRPPNSTNSVEEAVLRRGTRGGNIGRPFILLNPGQLI